jgi:hypothetical protein
MRFSEQTRQKYERLEKLGEGTYADVFKARIKTKPPPPPQEEPSKVTDVKREHVLKPTDG